MVNCRMTSPRIPADEENDRSLRKHRGDRSVRNLRKTSSAERRTTRRMRTYISLGEPESGKADPAGVLILQVSNVPVSFGSSRFWIQISSVTGQILAEIRGPIFPVTNGRLIAPGTSICRAA